MRIRDMSNLFLNGKNIMVHQFCKTKVTLQYFRTKFLLDKEGWMAC